MAGTDVVGPAPSAAASAISLATPAVFGVRAVGWGALVAALTGHGGESRVVLTSRVVPAGLDPVRVQVLPVHALSAPRPAPPTPAEPPHHLTAQQPDGRLLTARRVGLIGSFL
jgi:hypothetical protein